MNNETVPPPIGHPLRAAHYGRVSTVEQANGWSPGEQERLALERCAAEGWDCDPARDLYLDAGWSGGREDRPALQRLLASIRDATEQVPRYDFLVVWKLDRLTRNLNLLTRLLDEFDRRGIRLVSLTEPFDGSTAMGRAMIEVAGVFAQLERAHATERTQMGKRAAARKGRRNGGPRPYGFTQAGGVLDMVEHEVAVLRRIGQEYVAGRTQSQIARDLNLDGIVTVRGKAWSQAQVSAHLRNPLYRGSIKSGTEIFPGNHAAVYEGDLAEQIDRLTSANDARSKGRGRRPKRHLLIGGALRCSCGASMRPRSEKKDYGSYDIYICDGRHSGASPDCTQKAVPRADVDTTIYRLFENVALDVEGTRRQIAERRDRDLGEMRALRENAEREMLRKHDALAKVERDYLEGDLGAATYERLNAQLAEDTAAAAAEVAQLSERERQVIEASDRLDAEEGALRLLTEVRQQIAGRIREAGLLDARGHRHPLWRAEPPADLIASVRAALAQVFESFTIHHDPLGEIPEDPSKPWCGAQGEYVIEPKLRDDAVGARVPLNHAADKYSLTVATS
jgi:site-specific DNA recombinase